MGNLTDQLQTATTVTKDQGDRMLKHGKGTTCSK